MLYVKLDLSNGLISPTVPSDLIPVIVLGDPDEWNTQDSYTRMGTVILLEPTASINVFEQTEAAKFKRKT